MSGQLSQRLGDLVAVQPRHADIQRHKVIMAQLRSFEGFLTVMYQVNLVPTRLQQRTHHRCRIQVVIRHQYRKAVRR